MTTTDPDQQRPPGQPTGEPHIEVFTGLRSGDRIRVRCTCARGQDHESGPRR